MMTSQGTVLPEIPKAVEIYAETAVDFELTLRSTTPSFPTARVAAAFRTNDLHPVQMDTTDQRIRVYTLTLYDPPEDVMYILQEMLSSTGVEIVNVKLVSELFATDPRRQEKVASHPGSRDPENGGLQVPGARQLVGQPAGDVEPVKRSRLHPVVGKHTSQERLRQEQEWSGTGLEARSGSSHSHYPLPVDAEGLASHAAGDD